MIRITIERHHLNSFPKTIVREFADDAEAATWFVEDSYFGESYTAKATWERIEPAEPAPQVTRVFTFGGATAYPRRFVEITAESIDHCRAVMLNHFRHSWSHDYPSREAAGVDRYGLTELPRAEWPPATGRWIVDASGLHQPGV